MVEPGPGQDVRKYTKKQLVKRISDARSGRCHAHVPQLRAELKSRTTKKN